MLPLWQPHAAVYLDASGCCCATSLADFRLNFTRKFTQPAAYAADLAAQYMGELLYYLVQGAWAVYSQLAAMKMLPQITAGELAAPGCGLRGRDTLQLAFSFVACKADVFAAWSVFWLQLQQDRYGVHGRAWRSVLCVP